MIFDHDRMSVDGRMPLPILVWIVETFGSAQQGRWYFDEHMDRLYFNNQQDYNLCVLKWS